MSAAEVAITIRVETTMLCAQLSCVSGIITAQSEWERQLETSALAALNEAQQLGDEARKELGVAEPSSLRLQFEVSRPAAEEHF